MLLQLLNKVQNELKDVISGTNADSPSRGRELQGGARLRHIFDDIYIKQLKEINASSLISSEEYIVAIRNSAVRNSLSSFVLNESEADKTFPSPKKGLKPSLFVPDKAFEFLVKRQISLLREPSLQCAELVMNELVNIVFSLKIPELDRFTHLRERVNSVASKILRKSLKPTQEMIENLIKCEMSCKFPFLFLPRFSLSLLLLLLSNQPKNKRCQHKPS